ncbi:hypothetical protein [Nitrospira sp. BLG_2]|uniref:hypothetical protein n=1 Tax=Nitrospira sp. BLG_2 TaxID=3397507 RepID=UPI003B99AFA3
MSKKKKHSVSVFGIAISPLTQTVGGVDQKIAPEDYRFNSDFKPSRNIRLIHGPETINVGVVKEVPKLKRDGGGSPATGGTRATNGQQRKGESSSLPYKPMPEYMMVEWDDKQKRLWMNQDHIFVKKYFLADARFVRNSPRHRRLTELYQSWDALAKSIVQVFETTEPEPKRKIEEWEDDLLNFTINRVIEAKLAADPLTMKQIEVIDRKIDATNGSDGEAEAGAETEED